MAWNSRIAGGLSNLICGGAERLLIKRDEEGGNDVQQS